MRAISLLLLSWVVIDRCCALTDWLTDWLTVDCWPSVHLGETGWWWWLVVVGRILGSAHTQPQDSGLVYSGQPGWTGWTRSDCRPGLSRDTGGRGRRGGNRDHNRSTGGWKRHNFDKLIQITSLSMSFFVLVFACIPPSPPTVYKATEVWSMSLLLQKHHLVLETTK